MSDNQVVEKEPPKKRVRRPKEDDGQPPEPRNAKCPHEKPKHHCRDCSPLNFCVHDKQKAQCRPCGGSSFCEHDRRKANCKECKGASICIHQIERTRCAECGGGSICEHGKIRSICAPCGGGSICEHGIHKMRCVRCDGRLICQHQKYKWNCRDPTCIEKIAEERRIVAERRAGRIQKIQPDGINMTSEYICSICKGTKAISEFWDPEKEAYMNICSGCAKDQLAEEEAELEMELRPSGFLDETLLCVKCGKFLPFTAFPTGTQIDEFAICTSCQESTPGQAELKAPIRGEGGGY
jgi:hypothetical protein